MARCLTRDSRTARRIAQHRQTEPYVVEHVSFALAFLPLLSRMRPDIVYFSEWHLGRVLARWRRVSRRSFGLVFCNGALVPGGYHHLDLVQQLNPGALEYSLARGEPAAAQHVLPLGVAMDSEHRLLSASDRACLRERLGLPRDRQIVMSAGAVNRQKRIDYLIDEIASMPAPRPFLLVVGQEERETAAIRALGAERLGPLGHSIRTAAPEDMAGHYQASDVFVLASLWESFGRVLVEAQAHGLPCLAHSFPVMQWVLGGEGDTADLSRRGAVSAWLRDDRPARWSEESRRRRHRQAYARFSWDMLAGAYAEMLRSVAFRRRPEMSGGPCR